MSQCHIRLTTWIRLILYITPYQHLITSHTHNVVSVNSTFVLVLLVIVVPALNKILSYLISYLILAAEAVVVAAVAAAAAAAAAAVVVHVVVAVVKLCTASIHRQRIT